MTNYWVEEVWHRCLVQDEALREIASLTAGIMSRLGASYGAPEEFRRDFSRAVQIMTEANKRVVAGRGTKPEIEAES